MRVVGHLNEMVQSVRRDGKIFNGVIKVRLGFVEPIKVVCQETVFEGLEKKEEQGREPEEVGQTTRSAIGMN